MPATESGPGAGDFVLVPGGPKLALATYMLGVGNL